MKPMDEINALIQSIEKESELSSDDQNLLYFYRLINDFFNIHKQHQNCTKEQLKDYVTTSEIVNYLDKLLQEE